MEAEQLCEKDRNEWGALVHMQMVEFYASIFALFLFFRTALSRSGGLLIPGEGWDAITR